MPVGVLTCLEGNHTHVKMRGHTEPNIQDPVWSWGVIQQTKDYGDIDYWILTVIQLVRLLCRWYSRSAFCLSCYITFPKLIYILHWAGIYPRQCLQTPHCFACCFSPYIWRQVRTGIMEGWALANTSIKERFRRATLWILLLWSC